MWRQLRLKPLLVVVAFSLDACSAQRVDPLQPVDVSIPLAGRCHEADHYFAQALAPVDQRPTFELVEH